MPKGVYERSAEQLNTLRVRLRGFPRTQGDNPNWRGGKTNHPLYMIYNDLKRRCTNPGHPRYADYGGRGISIHPEWRSDFWAFVRDVGERPEGKTPGGRAYWQLDRIDNDGNYEPGNVRWASPEQQRRNSRLKAPRDVCRRNHEMTEANSYYYPTGERRCRQCSRINEANRKRGKS